MQSYDMDPTLSFILGSLLAALGTFASGCSGDATGCSSDTDCRGARVCSSGICVSPGVDDDDDATTGGADTDSSEDIGWIDVATSPPPDVGANPDTGRPIDIVVTPDTGTVPDTTGQPDAPPVPDVAPDVQPDTRPDVGPDTGQLGPQVQVTPRNQIDFGTLVIGFSSDHDVLIENIGDQPLQITNAGLRVTPSSGFSVSGPSGPQTVAPGGSISYTITYQPTQTGQYRNHFEFQTNDPDSGDQQIAVTLNGTAFNKISQPCLFSSPDLLDYGVVTPGQSKTLDVTIGNCSTDDVVTVTAYNFVSNPETAFSIDPSSPQPPFQVPIGATETVKVTYTPQSKRTLSGELSIRSDEQTGAGDFVDLEGSGGGCAEAEAKAHVPSVQFDRLRDGPIPVQPMGTVEFDGTESTSPSGSVTYQWSLVSQPSSSSASLVDPGSATPTLTPTTPGVYEVKLDVTNPATGQAGCTSDTVEVVALSKSADLEVSGSWQADHDLDLHVVRSNSSGNFPAFRDATNDVYPDQPVQDWGATSDRTDDAFHLGNANQGGSSTNFGGETVLVPTLESGRSYRIALFFRDNDGVRPFQFSLETEIDVNGTTRTLTHSWSVRDQNTFWISFEIDGSTGAITEVDREQ